MKLCISFFSFLSMIVGLASGFSRDAPSPAPHLLFKLDFEDGFNAVAAGNGSPTNRNLPQLVEGISGKAALFKSGTVLRYRSKGNIDKRSGTISMWVQAPMTIDRIAEDLRRDSDDAASQAPRYTLFMEEGANVRGGNTTWLWLNGSGPRLRFDVRDQKDQYLYVAGLGGWKKGEWHHVAATWDLQRGTQVYLDGLLMGERQIPVWSPKTYEAFFLGALDATGLQPWNAAIDEISIHDGPLTSAQIRELFLAHRSFKVAVRMLDPYLSAAKEGKLKIWLSNPGNDAAKVTDLRYRVLDDDGTEVFKGELPDQVIRGAESSPLELPLTLPWHGKYRFHLSYVGNGSPGFFEEIVTAVADKEAPQAGASKQTRVAEVDAAKAVPLATSGKTKIVESPLGSYLEAGPARHDRFALGFEVEEIDAPHLAVITYPDDKPRTMEVILQDLGGKRDYQAQTGVFTGDEYPLSGRMVEHRFVFWPRSARQSLIFMTAEKGHPAAVKDFTIYRLNHLQTTPDSDAAFSGSVPPRAIGLYYEDPVLTQNFGQPPGRVGLERATERLLDYMQSFGQNLLAYPLAWYNGPLYGTRVEPREPDLGGCNAGDRPHPSGFPAYLLKRLASRGMTLNAGLHIHWLPSLNAATISNAQRIHAGEETVVNVRADGMPWWGHWHGEDPNYNAADPRVMASVKAVVDEMAERYGAEPAFGGVTLVLARNKLFQFGSIQSGYNDINLTRFQKDTGIVIPDYAPGKADRFAKSYRWLKENPAAMESWIDWRCRTLHAHYKEMADSLTKTRADLKLTLNLFLLHRHYGKSPDYLAEPAVNLLRESGIDPALYADDANIVMSYTLVPADYRWRRAHGEDAVAALDNRTVMTAPEIVKSYRNLPQTSVTIHDRYWEDAIGRKEPLKGLSPDPATRECPWRVSTLNAAGFHAMEPYAAALNNFDAFEIAKGGFLIGTFGMEKELAAFAANYRALPAIKFENIEGVEDPVRVRQKVVDGKLYFYALNRLPEPTSLKIRLNQEASVQEPAAGRTHERAAELALKLAPFELRTYRVDSADARVVGGKADVSPEWTAHLEARFEEVKRRAAPSPYLSLAEKCRNEKRYARLYFLLQERWAAAKDAK